MLSNTSKLKIEAIQLGWTQSKLARALGISPQYMWDIFQGRRRPATIIERLVEEFNFPRSLFEAPARKAA